MSTQQRLFLSFCHFTENDDLAYLQNDIDWIESRAERLDDDEKQALWELIQQLHRIDIGGFNKNFVNRVWKSHYDKNRQRQELVRNIFLAAVVREVILRTETAEEMAANRASFLDKFEFLRSEEGTDEELTWLVRYTRALKILAAIYEKGKKTLMMGVAAHLQGSSVYTEYTTGGANKPETARRVRLHEIVTGYTPKKRPARHGKKGNICVVTVKRGRGRPRKVGVSNPVSSLEMSNEGESDLDSSSNFDSEEDLSVFSDDASLSHSCVSSFPFCENYCLRDYLTVSSDATNNDFWGEESNIADLAVSLQDMAVPSSSCLCGSEYENSAITENEHDRDYLMDMDWDLLNDLLNSSLFS